MVYFISSSKAERRLRDMSIYDIPGVEKPKIQSAPANDDHDTPVSKNEYIDNLRSIQARSSDRDVQNIAEKEIRHLRNS